MPIDVKPKRGPVPKEVLEYFLRKGIKPGFSYRDVWREEHNTAFTVAKVMEKDILEDLRQSILKAIEEGTPLEEWKTQVKPLLDKSGWSAYGSERTEPHRLRTIYQTNMRMARAVGQWQRIQRTKRALPYLVYQLGPSENHREAHVAWSGLVLPVDHPFWAVHYPPNGYGCKCHVRQVTRSEAERLGGVSEAPDEELVAWKDPRTGDLEELPVGIHPAFGFNPGIEEIRRKTLSDRLEYGPPSWRLQ